MIEIHAGTQLFWLVLTADLKHSETLFNTNLWYSCFQSMFKYYIWCLYQLSSSIVFFCRKGLW